MSVRRELVKLVAFAVVAVSVLWLLWSTLLNVTSGPTHTYTAVFTDVSGLHEGDNVRIAGVRVGRVDALRLVGDHAEVTVSVRADQPVFENTRVIIRYQNLVGQRFVSLVPGAGAARPLADGARIPADRTEPSFDLSSLLNGFAPLFSVLQPAEVNRLSNTIVAVLQASGPEIVPLLDQTTQLTGTIADRDRVIGAVIDGLNPVLDQLAGKGDQTDALVAQTRRLVERLNAHTDQVFTSLDTVRRFTDHTRGLLADMRPDLRGTLRQAVSASDTYRGEKGLLGDTLHDFPPFLSGLARITQYGSWLNFYACGLKVHPVAAAPGVGTSPDDTQTEVCR